MTRPTYETSEDLSNERAVLDRLCSAWSVTAKKLPISYGFDYGLLRADRLCAAVEIKCRKKKYDTLILSLLKILRANALNRLGVTPIIAVRWPDGIYYAKLDQLSPDIRWGGRADRGDPADMEPVVHLPMCMFGRVE